MNDWSALVWASVPSNGDRQLTIRRLATIQRQIVDPCTLACTLALRFLLSETVKHGRVSQVSDYPDHDKHDRLGDIRLVILHMRHNRAAHISRQQQHTERMCFWYEEEKCAD